MLQHGGTRVELHSFISAPTLKSGVKQIIIITLITKIKVQTLCLSAPLRESNPMLQHGGTREGTYRLNPTPTLKSGVKQIREI
ncbi:MAG: hypothetical protein A2475_12800 [Ignavibacteria bacterium RIFOXYC2_FULL_35_21]|nr:MAG: hypothetical protein A2220_14895 [Ignavibacteria bacterium RIFOXYA2_FULL_35_10]OGV24461.1 MAG: hypothetical protein A2475_12800 [Ignavibacteria bacterium RIFOXYC2_FULL_35_21]